MKLADILIFGVGTVMGTVITLMLVGAYCGS